VPTSEEAQLMEDLDKLTERFGGSVNSVSRVVKPLLDVWSEAHEIDPELAEPLEPLLSAFAHRVLTTETELSAAIDEVRLRLVRRQALTSEVGVSS
jgi:hypothetical protein